MKRFILILLLGMGAIILGLPRVAEAGEFFEFMYIGSAEEWCQNHDCVYFLDQENGLALSKYDQVLVKWNGEYQRYIDEGAAVKPYTGAVISYLWNGNTDGGSGQVWHEKKLWYGDCLDGLTLENGGVCDDWFIVIMDHGTSQDKHIWSAHAKPTGLGTY